jgi:predicted nucleotidyltransferase
VGINERLKAQRDDILRLASRYGARNVRVFGSVARGEARPDSDIDFLIDLEPGRSLLDLSNLLLDLQDLLGCKVDVVPDDSLHWYIKDRVLQEAIPL